MDKLIITAAICGAEVTKEHNPAVPYTIEEIAREAELAAKEGASIIHLHVREDDPAVAGHAFHFARHRRRGKLEHHAGHPDGIDRHHAPRAIEQLERQQVAVAGAGVGGSSSVGFAYCDVPATSGMTFGLNLTF